MRFSPKNKKGGVVTSTVMAVGGLIIAVIVVLVITTTVINANLFGSSSINVSNGTEANTMNAQARLAIGNMSTNFTDGIDEVSSKVPTILLIVAVVFLFGALVLLMRQAKGLGIGGGGGSSL